MDPSQLMGRSFPPMWGPPPPPPIPSDDPSATAPFLPPPSAPNRGWKRKNPNTKPNPGVAGYQPPALGDLQVQNRAKARRWFKNPNPNQNNRKHFFHKPKAAAAPRNTTSFIIRAKRSGGIASLVSPCPVTPAVLPTPRLSPSREGLADMAQAQWGVDGYGSMKGLIRLRTSPQPANPNAAASDDDDDGNSSGSDVEEHVEVERRLDHDLSRFEMVYPGRDPQRAGGYMFEEDDEYDIQDVHVARLEEENLTLKERLFLMEQEVADMRRRLEALEARFAGTDAVGGGGAETAPELALENDTERGDAGPNKSCEDNAERGDVEPVKSCEDCAKGGGVDLVKSCEDNAEMGDVEPLRSCEDNAERGDMEPEKSGENNEERDDAGSSEDNGQVSMPEASAMD